MLKIIVVISLLAVCFAAPYPVGPGDPKSQPHTTLRPSPINPDIAGDPKPEDKIILLKNSDNRKGDQNDEKDKTNPGPITRDHKEGNQQPKKRETENSPDCHDKDKKEKKDEKPKKREVEPPRLTTEPPLNKKEGAPKPSIDNEPKNPAPKVKRSDNEDKSESQPIPEQPYEGIEDKIRKILENPKPEKKDSDSKLKS